jgi:hypothetical protein
VPKRYGNQGKINPGTAPQSRGVSGSLNLLRDLIGDAGI